MATLIEQLAENLGEQLKKKGWRLVTAESCTGGGLSYAITDIAGASQWFDRGFITYSNIAKEELLGVKTETLKTFGSVSEETAREMAEGALYHNHSQAHISIAITGIAGPDGGSAEKPVGTVWIACAGKSLPTMASHYIFSGNRKEVRQQAIEIALKMLQDQLGKT
ncbi:MAG TPA: CinA family protein [Candidatus Angelobacter sp.]|jgi:nicotinamide-nucleotide amidase|nr:CinA family protein [Candidatus Angelobacter sp.]